MVTKVLVKELIDDGRRLLEALDAKRFPIDAAFWVHHEDSNRWRLAIVSPVANKGSFKAIERIQPILRAMDPPVSFMLEDTWAMSKSSDVFKRVVWETSGLDRRSPPKGRIRESNGYSDAYIYRW